MDRMSNQHSSCKGEGVRSISIYENPNSGGNFEISIIIKLRLIDPVLLFRTRSLKTVHLTLNLV